VKFTLEGVNNFESVKSFLYHVHNKDGTHFVYKLSDVTVVCGRNEEQIEVRKYLLSFGSESFVFQVAIQKFKDQGT